VHHGRRLASLPLGVVVRSADGKQASARSRDLSLAKLYLPA